MNLIAEIVGSYWLALIFQTSHVISEVCALFPLAWLSFCVIFSDPGEKVSVIGFPLIQVEWPKPDKDNVVHMDWYVQ